MASDKTAAEMMREVEPKHGTPGADERCERRNDAWPALTEVVALAEERQAARCPPCARGVPFRDGTHWVTSITTGAEYRVGCNAPDGSSALAKVKKELGR